MREAARIEEAPAGLQVRLPGRGLVLVDRVRMPDGFLCWQSQARLRMFDQLARAGAGSARSHPAHLPVLATLGEGLFPINLACKGMGPLPRAELLAPLAERFEAVRAELDGEPWEATLPRRLETARSFYRSPEDFDRWALAGLELFDGRTARNLERNPLATLLFSGEPPDYPSCQLYGVVELIEGDDPRLRFLRAARELFARDGFHVLQPPRPSGFVFNVVEWRDKTPFSRV